MIHAVPEMFKPKIRVEYPPDNKQIFEEWFYDNAYVQVQEPWIKRHYLPIFWTSFQVNNDYGKGRKMHELQAYIDGLDRSKKYFTITQYDDGPLVDFKDLDIVVFGSGGGRIDVPIPLVCMPHPYKFDIKERKYLASFIGSITHPLRQQMVDAINSLPKDQRDRYYIWTHRLPIEKFCEIMADSKFALCPRGYGKSSFRICESLQYGTTPVYISDEFIEPFDETFFEFGTKIQNPYEIHEALDYMDSNGWEREGHQEWWYQHMYTFEALKTRILEWLKRLS